MTAIRRIRVEEAPVVRELYRAMITEAAERHPEDRVGISERGLSNLETLFRLGAVHQDHITLVAEEDGEPVGFVLAEVTRGSGLPGLAGEVAELWVRPNAQGDIRERLIQEAVRELRERGAGPIFHYDDAHRAEPEPWQSLGFEPDVLRFSLYPEDGCTGSSG
jgi:predicted N-acetyltransferase YhbS